MIWRCLICCLLSFPLAAQSLRGRVVGPHGPIPGAHVKVVGTSVGAATDRTGAFELHASLPCSLEISALGFATERLEVDQFILPDIHLQEDALELNQVVVTGTREAVNRRESPVAVGVINDRTFAVAQALSLSEGLSFQPGLRVETNCSNCGFSALRLNGLDGPYTQILVDGRPIFSALNGVYGLEQIPPEMIDRIEVVRGGGSALYGANAIGGTVNIITRDPLQNQTNAKSQVGMMEGATDAGLGFHHAAVNKDFSSGWTIFGQVRNRDAYNANPNARYDSDGDGTADAPDDFSEMPRLRQGALGAKGYYRPNSTTRWGWEAHLLKEDRRGGNRLSFAPHQADVAEALDHTVGGAQLTWEHFSNGGTQRWSAYAAYQTTLRESYYGGGGDSPDSLVRAQARLFYGNTTDHTAVAGGQWVWNPNQNKRMLTTGIEVLQTAVNDKMPGYQRALNQRQMHLATYAQWQEPLGRNVTLLAGGRLDQLVLRGAYQTGGEPIDQRDQAFTVFNPRINLLYTPHGNVQLRLGYATGFRPPQAFDEDLHLSTLGGGANIIRLDPALHAERSHSLTAGVDWDRKAKKLSTELRLEGYYTVLNGAFYLDPREEAIVGSSGDTLALVAIKRNATGAARVYGASVEWNLATESKFNLQSGMTWNKATYDNPQEWFPGVFGHRILRAPEWYGYLSMDQTWGSYTGSATALLTGPMELINSRTETLHHTPWFVEVGLKLNKSWSVSAHTRLETSLGVVNLFNQFQQDLEVGPTKDAAYFYGPIRPRMVVVGVGISL